MAGANWAEQVDNKLKRMKADNNSPEMEIETQMEDLEKQSIYKLPTSITDLNKKAYIPQTVSFGPYHHGKAHLLPMEEHKERALLHFLKRSNKFTQSLIDSLAEVVKDLKSSYAMLPTDWQQDDHKFIQLMILDGCFMLEILHMYGEKEEGYAYSASDPIFSSHGKLYMIPYIRRDMLMLENQLPMLVLERLSACKTEHKDDEYLNKLILKLCSPNTSVPPVLGKCLHVLDVYRKSLLDGGQYQEGGEHKDDEHLNKLALKLCSPSTWVPPVLGNCLHVLDVYRTSPLDGAQYQGGGTESIDGVIIPSATELNEAGIRFKNGRNASLKNISFNRGALKLPFIVVDDGTESMFLNLIAFERYHAGAGNQVTSYIFFMYNIINTEKDVALLKSTEIIQNSLGSDKAVVELFSTLSKDISVDSEYKPHEVQNEVKKYYKKSLNQWRASLSPRYCSNPWVVISLIAAILLFAITIAQTVHTILPYYQKSSFPSPPSVPPPPPPPPTPPPPHPMIPPPPPVSRKSGCRRHM